MNELGIMILSTLILIQFLLILALIADVNRLQDRVDKMERENELRHLL